MLELRRIWNEYISLLNMSEVLGVTVSEEGEIIKDIMSEHPEYMGYLNGEEIKTKDGETINPTLHIVFEAIVQSQKAKGEPPEVRDVYITLLKGGVDPHEARHAIGRILSEMIWLMFTNKLTLESNNYYQNQLRELMQQKLKHHVFRDV